MLGQETSAYILYFRTVGLHLSNLAYALTALPRYWVVFHDSYSNPEETKSHLETQVACP